VSRKAWIISSIVLLVIVGAAGGGWWWRHRSDIPAVNAEAIKRRDLDAIVSASGKIQPKRSVNISAQTVGRVTQLVVEEGDRVKRGQFLMQIDPNTLKSAVQRGEASLGAARSALEMAKASVETAKASLDLAQTNLKRQQQLWADQLTTREALERAQNEVEVRRTELKAREQEVATRSQQIRQESATLDSQRYELTKVTIESPIEGIVTRRNIEEGETVVIGTMNNAGTVLLTIADMSVIEAEVEVDETNIPSVRLGQQGTVTIDALPDRTFRGHVTEIGNSPIQTTATAQSTSSARQATNFKVVVTLDERIEDVRPGFTCTADITTATRSKVLAVPIQAVTVREVTFDASGKIVHTPKKQKKTSGGSVEARVAAQEELKPGETRKETEGVFLLRGNTTEFVAVKVGIAGERYFEAVSGLREGDLVITGPFDSVRQMDDGDEVKLEEPGSKK
jgi:HlyD family secretion protein